MKRKITLLLLTLVCFLGMNAQTVLRENVVIVKPSYTPSSVKFITDLSKVVRKDGYKKAADILDAYTKGGFGSGFIYTNPNTQKKYIVTNRHVVAQADVVEIEIQYSNAPTVEFKDCPIIAVDELLDLALIELPADAKISNGLEIETNLPEEGETVFSAGFPGLNNKPSWQLGQGIISNNSVHDKILSGTNSIGAIQHTAQVSAGSSGGPLLIKTGDTYKIVGVNTWKIADRENTNFSISAKSLIQFLDEQGDFRKRNSNEDLQKRAKGFAAAMKTDYMAVLPYISTEYISNISVDHFHELINAVPDSISDNIASCFNNGHPIDGVRIGLAYIMFKKIAGMNLEYKLSGNIEENSKANVMFTSDKKDFSTIWIFEQGEWKLQELPALKLTDLEDQGVSKRFGYKNSFKVGIENPLTASDIWAMQYYATYEYTLATFITTGFSLGTGKLSYNPYAGMAGDEGIFQSKSYISGSISMGGQLPIKVSSLYVIPNLKGFIEINSNEVDGALGYVGGVEVAYKLNRKTYLIGGLSYKQRSFNTNDPQIFKNYSTLGLHLGITW